jgi:hypothetical protein
MCSEGFGAPAPARAERENYIGGIGCSLDQAPEDRPRSNAKAVLLAVILADVH